MQSTRHYYCFNCGKTRRFNNFGWNDMANALEIGCTVCKKRQFVQGYDFADTRGKKNFLGR